MRYKGFNQQQIKEIKYGLAKNRLKEELVAIYAKPEFSYQQMKQIRLGLEKGINLTSYVGLEFDYQQMEQVRLGLENNVNVSLYAKIEFFLICLKC